MDDQTKSNIQSHIDNNDVCLTNKFHTRLALLRLLASFLHLAPRAIILFSLRLLRKLCLGLFLLCFLALQ